MKKATKKRKFEHDFHTQSTWVGDGHGVGFRFSGILHKLKID